MTRLVYFLVLICSELSRAQDVGTIRGENAGPYNITNSFETGYRLVFVSGDEGKYRSDVNLRDGFRLLSSAFTAHSKDGHGPLLDELSLTTQGLGNDPYQSANFHLEKSKLYEYVFGWRQNSYVNPGLTIASGLHDQDLVHRWRDHDLTILPRNWYQFQAGFSDMNERGPALSTVHIFDNGDSALPLFSDVRRRFYDFRLGAVIDRRWWRFTLVRRWQVFREDTQYDATSPSAANFAQLTSLQRQEPYHGTTPVWLGNLNASRTRYAVNAHLTYAGGTRAFVFDELASGTERFLAREQQIVASGTARRPLLTGDLSVSFIPTSRLTIVHNTALANTRIDGNAAVTEFDNGTNSSDTLNFQFLGIRTLSDSLDLHYRFADAFSAYGGFHYASRVVRSIQDSSVPGVADSDFNITGRQESHLHAGVAGADWTLSKTLKLRVEGEIGRNNNPFFPISERNSHALDTRLEYRKAALRMSAGYKQFYNNNSIDITAYSSRSRDWFGNVSWQASRNVALDVNYSNLHLDTLGSLGFFAGTPPDLIQGRQSIYVSNLHVGNFAMHWTAAKRTDLSFGFNVTDDSGDNRRSAVPADPVNSLLFSVRAFPVFFAAPYARLSIKLKAKLRWNASYGYSGYNENIHLFNFDQKYHAHTCSVSVIWAF